MSKENTVKLDGIIDRKEGEFIELKKARKDIYRKLIMAFLNRSVKGYYHRKRHLIGKLNEVKESVKRKRGELKILYIKQDGLIKKRRQVF